MVQASRSDSVIATLAGTVITILFNVSADDVGRTVVLAGVGAVVSFLVSLGIKVVFRKRDL